MEVEVNWLAVVIATVVAMVIGAVWYAPSVFGKTWIRLARIDMSKDRGSVLKPVATATGMTFLTALVLAHVAYLAHRFYGNSFLQDTVTTALWLWLGFMAARIAMHDGFEGRSPKLTLITQGHELVIVLAMALTIGIMGV